MSESASPEAGAAARAGLIETPLAAAVNHLLRSASWARAQLKPHSGKAVRFEVAPLSATLQILDSGEVAAASTEAVACFRMSPLLALRVAAADPSAWREVEASGDMSLARDILAVAQNLRWDYEEDLSRVFGDILAHRICDTGRALAQWQRDSFDSLTRQTAAYWTEERPLIAARPQIEQFSRDVDTLRDDTARVEKRVEQLLTRRNAAD